MFNIEPYLFLEWKRESFCCGDYVGLVLNDYLNAKIPPVSFKGGGPLAAANTLKNTPFRKLFKKIDQPIPFCVVELQQFKSADHVGVCVEIGGVLMVTHCVAVSGVLLSTFEEIKENYSIVGFYEYCG
jgi:hypothetical protein